jgi:hypothetical protein
VEGFLIPDKSLKKSISCATRGYASVVHHTAFGLKGWVYDEQETACQTDVFPWKLDPPIVHVERCWDREDRSDLEWKVRDFVDYFGGTFAGA